MNNNEILMYKDEVLMHELEALASYEPEDIDSPEIEVCYEHSGIDHFLTVCLVDLGQRALDRLRELEAIAKKYDK